jgi:hypothetical protein
LLVNPADFGSFELSELYLTTETRSSGGIFRVFDGMDLEMILSTKCEETLSFVDFVPPTKLEANHCQQSQQLHCLHLQTREMSVAMKFKTIQPTSGITTDYFAVFFRRSYDGCTIVVKPGMDPLPSGDAAIQDAFHASHFKWKFVGGISDRGIAQIPNGNVVYVTVKTKNFEKCTVQSLEPLPSPGRRKRKKSSNPPFCYALCITLLPGAPGNKSGLPA